MKPIFHHRPVNGPFEDPAVYIRILHEREGFLFDAGDVSRLSNRELLKLTYVFVTHTHIDHFIGFDIVLRALLKREKPVTFFGPRGIIDCVSGKLKGYTWNLISEYPLTIHVHEISEKCIETVAFRANENFRKVHMNSAPFQPVILDTPLFFVTSLILSHEIPLLGFAIKEKIHINIDRDKLLKRGLSVGPWLTQFKRSVRSESYDEVISTGTGKYKVSDMVDIYRISEGQKVSYIMDTSPVEENIKKITEFVKDSDTLYIEAYFSQNEIKRALERNHLTARHAGIIARNAKVKNLQLLHFSPRYKEVPELLIKEAFEGFIH